MCIYFIGKISHISVHDIGITPNDEKKIDIKNKIVFIHEQIAHDGKKFPIIPMDR